VYVIFFVCELRKEDKRYFYFDLDASLLLKKKFMKNGCSSSLSPRNYWMVALQFDIIIFLLFFTLHLLAIFWFLGHDRYSSSF